MSAAERPLLNIFVIDDEADILDLVQEFLEPRNYKVHKFSEAEELLAAAKAKAPLAIITDFKMPVMDGIQLTKKIREFDTKTKIALLTGFADKDLAIESLNSGITDLIEKPVTSKKLLDVIEKYRDHYMADLANEEKELNEIRSIFLEEARGLYTDIDNEILHLEEVPLNLGIVDSLFRRVHSVKGGSGSIPGAQFLAKLSHEFENALSMLRKGELKPIGAMTDLFLAAADTSRRLFDIIEAKSEPDIETNSIIDQLCNDLKNLNNIEVQPKTKHASTASEKPKSSHIETDKDDGIVVQNDHLDQLMFLSGELIVLKNTFDQVTSTDQSFQDVVQLRRRLSDLMVNLNKMTDELQSLIVNIRKIPLERALSKVPRLVRDTARKTGKKVALESAGLEMGVDKNLSKSLSQCLTHMVRNSIDHGIETPEDRVRKGKIDTGTIKIVAVEAQGTIRLTVTDDGKGIDKDRVLKKALSVGLLTEADIPHLKEEDIFALLFEPGFSTAEKVTDVSGRGVGMDAVKTAIDQHGGKIIVNSKPGLGTDFILEIPVPRAVMIEKTVLATSGANHFAIPLDGISRIVSCRDLKFFEVDGQRRCMLDGSAVPTGEYGEFLAKVFGSQTLNESQSCVFLRAKSRTVGLLVDRIEGQLEAVVKPFDPKTGELPGLKGTSIFGSDRVAFIVSPEGFLNLAFLAENPAAAA